MGTGLTHEEGLVTALAGDWSPAWQQNAARTGARGGSEGEFVTIGANGQGFFSALFCLLLRTNNHLPKI